MKIFKSIIITATLISFIGCSSNNNKFDGNWIEVMPFSIDVVQGMNLNPDGKAKSIGMATLQYERWKAEDDKLILWGKSIGNGQTIDFSDTLTIVSVTADSLLLDKHGRYRIKYYKVASMEDIKPFNVLDSLHKVDYTTELETRVFNGSLSMKSCIEVQNELTIYNYKNSGDGVFKLTSTYIRADGEKPSSNSYGRIYTLRGDATNKNAIVYQLIPFDGSPAINFLYEGDKMVLLNDKLEKPENEAIFTIK